MAISFLKKEGSTSSHEREDTGPVVDAKNKVVFVNGSKYRRAQAILALLTGKTVPLKAEDVERKDHYIKQLAKHGVEVNSEEALPALYELLGGLSRTPEEQKKADIQAKKMRSKGKKKMIQ